MGTGCLFQFTYSAQSLVKVEGSHQKLDTVKSVLSSHLKIDKTKVLMENGSLMKMH